MNDEYLQHLLQHSSIPSVILYGSDTRIPERLYAILSSQKPIQLITHNRIPIRKYDDCYEFNMSLMKKDNLHSFNKYYQELSNYHNHFKDGTRYLILNRYETCNPLIQEFLRVPIETSRFTKHLIITKNMSKVHPAIRSRSLPIRLTQESPYPDNFSLPHEIINETLMEIYRHDFSPLTKCTLRKIKEISSDIIKYNLSLSELLGDLLQRILTDVQWIHKIKYDIVTYLPEQETLCNNAYRKIILVESTLIGLYYRLSLICD